MKYISYELAMNYLMNNKNIFIKIKNSFLASYKNYKEELDFIRTAHNWNDEKFWEYQKNVVGACIGSGLDPKYLLDSDIAFIKKEEKLSDADRLKLEEYEKERQALVEKDRKKAGK